MANQERIDEFVSEAGFAQIEKLVKALDGANETFIKCLLTVEKYNAAIAKSGGLKELISNQKKYEDQLLKTVLAEEKVIQAKLKTEAFIKKEAADFESRVQKQIAIQERKSAKSVKLTESERLAEIKLEQDRKKSFDKYEAQVNKQNAIDEKRAQVIAANSRPYAVLSNELEKQRKLAQDLAIVYGENSKQFLEAAKGVFTLDTRLKAIDATLGKSQRNVGNYKSGFNGLANSVNQMTRELPAFTFSVQTGFLALSNNIPIFFDQIQQTRAEIARLRAEGQKVPGLFRQLASSIFSFGTVMSVGITLLTVYGKEIGEFFGAMFKGKEALDKFTESQRILSEALKGSEYTNAIKNVNELKVNIDLAKQGVIDKNSVLKQYNETIGKTTGEVKSLDQAESDLTKNAPDYIKMTLYKAAAQLALEEAAKKSYEAELARTKKTKEFYSPVEWAGLSAGFASLMGDDTKLLENRNKEAEKRRKEDIKSAEDASKTQLSIFEEYQSKAAEIAKSRGGWDFLDNNKPDGNNKPNTDEFDLQKQRLESAKDSFNKLAEDESRSFEDRINSLRNYNEASRRIIELESNNELAQTGLTEKRRLIIKEKSNNDLLIADREYTDKTNKLFTDQLNEEQKERLRINQAELSAINDAEAAKLDNLNVSFANREISEKQFGEKRQEIQREYIQKYIDAEIKQVEALKDIAALDADQRAKYEKDLSDLKLKLSREVTKNQIEDNKAVTKSEEYNAKKRADIDKELANKKKQLQKEVFDLGVAVVNGVFEREKNKVQDEMDLNDKRKQSDIENVNNSLLTEQEKADKIKVIEAQSLSNKEMLELKEREIEKRKANFQKIMAVAEVGINTAKDVAKVSTGAAVLSLTPVIGPVLAASALAQIPWMIGIGAAQIAAILAMPAFEHGGTMKQSGNALYGEVGTELRIEPDGQMSFTPDKPTIGHVKAGTRFISNTDLVRMTAKPELYPELSKHSIDVSGIIKAQEKSTKQIIKAYNSQKNYNTLITKRGWRRTQSDINNLDRYLKNNFN